MSVSSFICPRCKIDLVLNNNSSYGCKRCNKVFPFNNGYVDFLGDADFYAGEVSKKEMQILLHEIDSVGYDKALGSFFEKNSRLRNYITDFRRADWISHCISSNNYRCLDVGSGLGNVSEILSHIYHQVYSLEAVIERIEFQKRKFRISKRNNIIISRGNALELPFPDGHFDFVACNGVLEWIGTLNKTIGPRDAQLSFLRELKRVVSATGCVYIGIENRFGIQFLLGRKDHSGLPYTSLLPRTLASLVVKSFGPAGGIYGDTPTAQKEKRGYHTYTYSLQGYRSLLKEAGFKFKSYWVFPGYAEPTFSGNLEDRIAVKGFLRYMKGVNPRPKFKLAISLLERLNNYTLSIITNMFSPDFLFYCYKEKIPDSFEDTILKNSFFKNVTAFSGDKEIGYVLYDATANPANIVRLKRYGYELPNDMLQTYDKTAPGFNPTGRAWIENWITGRAITPTNIGEAKAAFKWLVDFQRKTRSTTPLSENEVHSEVNAVRTKLVQIPDMNRVEYREWLDDYESYLLTLDLNRTSEHGDFFHSNILIDPKRQKITVIDWNYFRKEGDPFFDFVFFIVCGMQLPTRTNDPVLEFRQNINGQGFFSRSLYQLNDIMDSHFNFRLDLQKLIRYTLLRYMIRKYQERGQNDIAVSLFRSILEAMSTRS